MSRWRTAFRFLLRSLDLRAAGFALALLAVLVGASVATTVLGLRADLRSKMTRELRAYGPNLLITPPLQAAASRSGGASLDAAWAEGLPASAPPGIEVTVSPILLAAGSVAERPAALVGVRFGPARELGSAWRVEGAWPAPDDADGCLLGAALAEAIGAGPGDPVKVRPAGAPEGTLRVSGVLFTGEAEDQQVLVPLPWLQERTGSPGRVSLAALAVAAGPAQVEAMARQVEAGAPSPVEARPLLQVSRAQGALLEKLEHMMLLLTGVVLLLAGMCVMTTLMSIVVERQPEIGLMRSLGASDAEILRMLLGEATLLGALGGVLGLALGLWNARWIGHQVFAATVAVRPEVIPLALGITLALCWMAVILPLRRALRVEPAAALRGE